MEKNMKAEKQLKSDKYTIYCFLKYLKERMDMDIINVCDDTYYESKKIHKFIGNHLNFNSINDLKINFFNFKLNNDINESIVFIRLKKEEMNRKKIKKH